MAAAKYLVPYVLITAFTYVFAKDGLSYASPFVYGTFMAFLTLVPLIAVTRGKMILNKDTILFGVFYWLSGATWLLGLNLISSSQSAILSFTMPLFAIPLSVLVLGEHASRVEAYGALVGFVGIILYNIPLLGGSVTLIGAGLTLTDAFFWALFSVYMRRLRTQDPAQTLVTASFVSSLLFGAFSATDFVIRPSVALAVDATFSGTVAGALCIFLWAMLVRTDKMARLTTMVFMAPVVTLVYGVATTRIIPSFVTLSGVFLIFVGIYASNMLAGESDVGATPVLTQPPSMGRDS